MASGTINNYEVMPNSLSITKQINAIPLARINGTTRAIQMSIPYGYRNASVTLNNGTLTYRVMPDLQAIPVNATVHEAKIYGYLLEVIFTVSDMANVNDSILINTQMTITLSK